MSPTVLEPSSTPIHDTVQELVNEVRSQGNFDASETEVLKWLTRRHRKMCERSRCFRKTLLQNTVKEQVSYPIAAEVIQIREVLVWSPSGSVMVPYGTGRHTDIAQGALHYLWLTGLFLAVGGGIAGGDWNEAGESQLFLYPTPTESITNGLKVVAVCIPPDLKIGEDSTIKVPGTYLDHVVAGAMATGLSRLEGRLDQAQYYEQIFNEGCAELLTETNRKHRGPGPAEIRVAGYNA